MRQFIKSYHVFVPQIWSKLFLYLGYPLLLIWLSSVLLGLQVPIQVCVMVAGSLIVMIEVIWDSMVFGGIASKDTNKLEYLKTSIRGMRVLRNSIIADALRRCFSIAVVFLAIYVLDSSVVNAGQLTGCIFVTLSCVELGLLITRSFSMMVVVFITLSAVGGVCMVVSGVVLLGSGSVLSVCLTILCYLLICGAGRVIIMQKAKGSYYDERN